MSFSSILSLPDVRNVKLAGIVLACEENSESDRSITRTDHQSSINLLHNTLLFMPAVSDRGERIKSCYLIIGMGGGKLIEISEMAAITIHKAKRKQVTVAQAFI